MDHLDTALLYFTATSLSIMIERMNPYVNCAATFVKSAISSLHEMVWQGEANISQAILK